MYEKALEFATKAHKGQKRKYTGEDYIVHPIEVSEYFDNDFQKTVAVLHDTVEDTDVTFTDIAREFGDLVMTSVWWLTDETTHEKGNRRARKEIQKKKIGSAPVAVQEIKIVDWLCNFRSFVAHDVNFAKVACEEILSALEHIEYVNEGRDAKLNTMLVRLELERFKKEME